MDWNQQPLIVVKDLITETNPEFASYYDKYNLGTPTATTDNGRNTKVTLTPKPGSGQNGTVDLYYNRITASDYIDGVGGHSPDWPADLPKYTSDSKSSEILVGVNAMLGIQLTDNDLNLNSINNSWYIGSGGAFGGIQLVMRDINYLFIPESILSLNVQFRS